MTSLLPGGTRAVVTPPHPSCIRDTLCGLVLATLYFGNQRQVLLVCPHNEMLEELFECLKARATGVELFTSRPYRLRISNGSMVKGFSARGAGESFRGHRADDLITFDYESYTPEFRQAFAPILHGSSYDQFPPSWVNVLEYPHD